MLCRMSRDFELVRAMYILLSYVFNIRMVYNIKVY